MRFPRPTKRRLVQLAVTLAAALAVVIGLPALFMAVATPSPLDVPLPAVDPSVRLRVYVLAWGYHTSIFVEQAPGWRLGPEGDESARIVEYGWGDRSFYMESNFCPESLFAAAFVPTPTVVYVRGHDRPPNEFVVGGVISVRECSTIEVLGLVRILEGQMDRSVDGLRPKAYPPVEGYGGRFYPGREYYVIWWNCNEWTARMLRDAGMASSSALVATPGQVTGRLVGFEAAERTAGG